MNSVKPEADYFRQEHVHTPGDGRGPRHVFIDGAECSDVTYADTKLGIAVIATHPLRVLPGTDYIDETVVMGDVRVEPKEAVDE
ncbi:MULTISPECIES: hypothetical protein [unclassified Pseudomonas]|uniref:hypothetical protein n=1 Tax=unclassified Pseudomonas TaxID=196821 RepID=UPI0025EDF9BA|nr:MULTISPECIES: hypothetical protein [unclassified Pseudomonas]